MIKKILLFSLIANIIHLPLIVEAEMARRVDKDGVVHLSNLFPAPKKKGQKATKQTKKKAKRASIRENIKYYSEHYGVDPELVTALIKAESDFQPRAVSPAGAMGLMQLMPATAARYGVANPFDPEENIRGGVKYLRYLLELFEGNIRLAIAAFNSGEKAVMRYNKVPSFTEPFVQKVISLYRERKGLTEAKIHSYSGPDGTLVFTNMALF